MKLYRVFRMGGQPVLSAGDFLRRFDPEDFLRQRELAAGFALQHLRDLPLPACSLPASLRERPAFLRDWCARLLFQVALNWERAFPELPFPTAGRVFLRYSFLQEDREVELLEALEKEPFLLERLNPLHALAEHTGLPESQRQQLYGLLACSYLLADRSLDRAPLTPEAARAAFLREPPDVPEDSGWQSFPLEGPLALHAREAPYRILLAPDIAKLRLKEDSNLRIRTRKLTALPHLQGSADLPVRLEVFSSPDDPAPEQITFFPGDFRYCSFVGPIPVHIHPVSVPLKDGGSLERQGNRLVRLTPEGTAGNWSLNCQGREIVSFAVFRGDDLVILEPDRVDYSRCWNAGSFPARPRRQVVEARYEPGGELLLLLNNGNVISTWRGILRRSVPTLQTLSGGAP